MLTSVSTSRASPGRLCRQGGFSLLELLVVVVLLGMLMMVMVPRLIRDDTGRQLQQESARISDMVSQLTEQALFRGDLLALRLETDAVEPLRYDWQEEAFVAFETGPLRRHGLPEGVSLEWDTVAPADDGQPSLADAAEVILGDGEEPGEEPEPLPQVFFFPSGEVSPITLRLYAPDTVFEEELYITSIGTSESDRDGREFGDQEQAEEALQ
jgi:general secretion pathway protein H